MNAGRTRLGRGEWLVLAAAVAIAHGFYARIVRYPSDFDAVNYLQIAADIVANGLFRPFYYANVRTYGYPLFLAALERASAVTGLDWRLLVFEVQLVVYLGACVALRHAVARRAADFAPWVLATLALNVFALSYTPESLTESLSASLVMLAAALWIRMREPGAALATPVLMGSLLVSYAVMVRPAALFALAAWVAALVLLAVERRPGWRRTALLAALLVVGSAAPVAPQIVNNVRNYGEATPLVVARLGTNQQIWGIQYLKYATALPPVPLPSVFYDNPMLAGRPIDSAHPLAWYVRYPSAGVRTLALHAFNMLDQDLLFTYARTLDPWYRIPLAIVNHAMLALAMVAAVLMARRGRAFTVTGLALAAFVLAHVALHATTAVEMRFGLPLLVLAGPMAAWTVRTLARIPSAGPRAATAAFVVAWVALALLLSDWVRAQAPQIRAWQAAVSP